jgi:hypothetical protein
MPLSKFILNSVFHSHDLSNKRDLFITSHNTRLFEHSIANNSVLIYNKLSSEAKC